MIDPGLVGFLLGLTSPITIPVLLCILGFGCAGIRRYSVASEYQSIMGDVPAGSTFSHAQSWGMKCPWKIYISLALLLGAAGFLTGDICFYESQDLQYGVISVQNLLRTNSSSFSFNNNSTSFNINDGLQKVKEDISDTAEMFLGGHCDGDLDCLDLISYCHFNDEMVTDGKCTSKLFIWFIIVPVILVIMTLSICCCYCCCCRWLQ